MEIITSGEFNPLSTIPYYMLIGGEMLVYEELINVNSFVDQNPSGLGDANKITVHYGGVVGNGSSPVQLVDVAGVGTGGGPGSKLICNVADTYLFEYTAAVGRTGGAGVSEVWFRLLVNGTQAAASTDFKLDDSEVRIANNASFVVPLTVGLEIEVEIMRNNTGNNSGGLLAAVNAEPSLWSPSASAGLRVGRYVLPL